jgi:hypothetical protein
MAPPSRRGAPVTTLNPLRYRLSRPFLLVAALAVLFEEWLWRRTAAALRRLGRWPVVARLERWTRRRSPTAACALFALPVLTTVAAKVAGVALIVGGQAWAGVVLLVCEKIVGTALVARLYQLTRPALNRLPPIAWLDRAVRRIVDAAHRWLNRQRAYVEARAYLASLRGRGALPRRLRAAYRLQSTRWRGERRDPSD